MFCNSNTLVHSGPQVHAENNVLHCSTKYSGWPTHADTRTPAPPHHNKSNHSLDPDRWGSTTPHATIGPTVSDTTRTSTSTAAVVPPPRPRAAPLCKNKKKEEEDPHASQSARQRAESKYIDHEVERANGRGDARPAAEIIGALHTRGEPYPPRPNERLLPPPGPRPHQASSMGAFRTGARARLRPAVSDALTRQADRQTCLSLTRGALPARNGALASGSAPAPGAGAKAAATVPPGGGIKCARARRPRPLPS